MEIYACPRCGSRNLRAGTIKDGMIFGITSCEMVCRKCQYKGTPIIFDSLDDYNVFLSEIKNKEKTE